MSSWLSSHTHSQLWPKKAFMPHWSKHIVFSLLFTTADGTKKIPWVVVCGDQAKQLLKVSSVALLVGLLQEYGTTEKGKERKRCSIDGVVYMYTCVLILRKDSPLSNLSSSIQMKKNTVANVTENAHFLPKCCRFSSILAAVIKASSVSDV